MSFSAECDGVVAKGRSSLLALRELKYLGVLAVKPKPNS